MKRTRLFAVAVAVAALAVQTLGVIPASSQKVSNPSGPFTYTIHTANLRIKTSPFGFDDQHTPGCSNGTNDDEDFLGDTSQRQDSQIDFSGGDPQCTSATDDSEVQAGFQAVAPVTITGTVNAAGVWAVNPTTGVSFPPAYAYAKNPIGSGFIVTITISGRPSADTWTGNLNPLTGAANLPMQLRVSIVGSSTIAATCHIGDDTGADRLIAQASTSGFGGVPYNQATGQMTMGDAGFRVPVAKDCGNILGVDIADQINTSFGVPTTDTDAVFTGDFPPGNKPLRAITPAASATAGVACRTTVLSGAGSTAARPIATYGFDDTNNGSIDATSAAITRNVTYPNSGPQTARVRVTDDQGDVSDATTSFTVGANLAPSAPNQNLPRSAAGAPVNFTLGGIDPEGGAVSSSVIVEPVNGVRVGNTYTPNPGFGGSDVLTYKNTDDCAESSDSTGTVTFNVNRLPSASNQTIPGTQDIPVSFTLTGTDPDGDSLTFTHPLVTAQGGTLSGTSPNLQYTPPDGFFGLDTFLFSANDGLNGSAAPGTITFNVVKNAKPVANPQNVTVPEDGSTGITLTGSDADLDPLGFTVLTDVSNGQLTGTAPNLTYAPDANFHGTDSFTFQVSDGKGGFGSATVAINVTSVNDLPTANNQSFNLQHDTSKVFTLDVNDPDGDTLSFSPTTPLAHGILTGSSPNFTYVPSPGYIGPDVLVYSVNDGNGGSASATVNFNVTATNLAPVAGSATVNTNEDINKAITLNASDPEAGPIAIAITQQPLHGQLTGTAPNLTYDPDDNYFGPDSFKFSVTDDQDQVSLGTISINVLAVNDTPVGTPQTVSTNEDTAKSIILGGTDVDSAVLTYQVVSLPTHGTVTGTAPNVTYTPAANYNGPDSFTFRTRDAQSAQSIATITINVVAVNDAPKATSQAKTVAEDGTLAVTLAGTDIDSASLTFSVVTGPAHGALTGSAPNLTYKPAANYSGIDSFTYKANDGALDSPAVAVTISVTAVNDVPVANAQTLSTLEDTAKAIVLSATDAEPGTLTYRIEVAPAHGKITGTGTNITYTPTANYTGPDSFKFSATDAQGTKGTATISITVDPAPMIGTKVVAQPTVMKKAFLGLGPVTLPNLRATLTRTDTNAPLAGRTIDMYVNGPNNVPVKVCSAVTTSAGVATCSGNAVNAVTAANYYTANFAGDPDFAPSFGTAGVTG